MNNIKDLRDVSAMGERGFPFHRKPVEAYANYLDTGNFNKPRRVGSGNDLKWYSITRTSGSNTITTTPANLGDIVTASGPAQTFFKLATLPVQSMLTGVWFEMAKAVKTSGTGNDGTATIQLYVDGTAITAEVSDEGSTGAKKSFADNLDIVFENGGDLILAVKRDDNDHTKFVETPTKGQVIVGLQFVEITRKDLKFFETDETAQDKRYGSRQDT